MDKLYTSPMEIQSKYTGELNKRRKSDPPPYPPTVVFRRAKLSSKDSQAEYAEWVDKQAALDAEGFKLLAEHFRLDVADECFYSQVALRLARNHVPAFRMQDPGKQAEWTREKLQLLAMRVEIKVKEGLSRADAIKKLGNAKGPYSYNGNREGLRNLVVRGEKEIDLEHTKSCTLEHLLGLEKLQVDLIEQIAEEKKQWHA
jgi:hypothetical protein